jgi:undecaprenyl diphosphate synthase
MLELILPNSECKKIPAHVAIIMDGNGRWAEHQGLARNSGHAQGVTVVIDTILAAKNRGIKYLTFFAFGQENWSRPNEEVDGLMSLGLSALAKYLKVLIKHKVKLRFIGDLNTPSIPNLLKNKIKLAEELTRNNSSIEVIIAFNYSGRWDIANAFATIISNNLYTMGDDIKDLIAKNLQVSDIPDPDLFIRTSGEVRVSNFYLWQLAYTEMYFTKVNWPDFTTQEFYLALDEYAARDRRFGMTKQQVQHVAS